MEIRQRAVHRQLEFVATPSAEKPREEAPAGFDYGFLVFALITLVFLTTLIADKHSALPEAKPPNQDNSIFSEIRAAKILHELSDFGSKPAGSEACEGQTRGRILREIQSIRETASDGVRFEVETQFVSGCFSLPKFDTDGFAICYKNVSNLIARLSGRANGSAVAVLLNCHYDSWPGSPAGSDDLSSCAVMLELMRVLATKPHWLPHSVVFLFNGAEESSLLAAHGFITQHKWRHDIRAFINLEASGSGGRELLFQAGPANEWLLNAYLEAAVWPHCSVLGQEIFQSGVYPGDTDFRIFRDYGAVPGLDIAFVQNGFWWHTEFDEARRISAGALQRAGDNVLAVLVHLLNSTYLTDPSHASDEKYIFFDFVGSTVIKYSLYWGSIVNNIVIFIAFASVAFRRPSIMSFVDGVNLVTFFHMYLAVIASVLIFAAHNILGPMFWYSQKNLVLFVYVAPFFLATLIFTSKLTPRSKRGQEKQATSFELASDFCVAVLLLVLTSMQIASAFIVLLVALPAVVNVFSLSPFLRTFLRFALALPGIIMTIYTSVLLASIFIPIMGRTSTYSEPFVMIIVLIALLPVVRVLVPIALRTQRLYQTYLCKFIFGLLLVTYMLIFVGKLYRGPYHYEDQYPTTKRIQLFHVDREFQDVNARLIDNSSYIYAISHDSRGAFEIPFVQRDADFKDPKCTYESAPYCEIPLYFPTRDRIRPGQLLLKPAPRAVSFSAGKSRLRQVSKTTTERRVRYELEIAGSGQISVYVTALNGSWISEYSMGGRQVGANFSEANADARERNLFLYFTCSGPTCASWNVGVTLQRASKIGDDAKLLLVGVVSHHLHGSQYQSAELVSYLDEIRTKRRTSNGLWAITASAWNVHMIYEYH